MKKILSIVLAVAMLLSMFSVIPVMAEEVVEETPTKITTALGDYYKFTFGEDGDQYDYTVANKTVGDTTGQATYKGNTFYPYVIENADASKASTEYKTITTPEGETYDVLEIKTGANGYFVPMTKDGTPFELIPGVKYSVNVKVFNPVINAWGQIMYVAGGLNDKVADYTKSVNGVSWRDGEATANATNKVAAAFRLGGGFGAVSGNGNAVYMKPGSYGTGWQTLECIQSQYEVECEHAAKSFQAYKENTSVIGIPEANGVYDEENGTYSIKYSYVDETPDDTSDDVYVTGHNYLSFTVSGGTASAYKTNTNVPLYSNATAEEMAEAGDSSVWQIVSIEVISENFKSNVSYSVNGEIIDTYEGEVGSALEAVIPEAPEGKYFAGWYVDEDCTELYTSTTLEFGQKTVYAGFKDYGKSVKIDFEDGTSPETAVKYTAAGISWPLRGYSYKGSSYDSQVNKGELKAHLEREGLSTEFPASAVAFYSDRTWAMPGGMMLANSDGTLFVPKAGEVYKVTYKYMAPVHNGNNTSINVVYGIVNSHANASTTGDKGYSKATLKWNAVTEAVREWTTVTEYITIPEAADDHVAALGLDIQGVRKVAEYEEDGETVKYYNYTAVLLDYIEVELVPTAMVTFIDKDGALMSESKVAIGTEINYPVLSASLNGDVLWSLSDTEYVAVPEILESNEGLTVYVYESPVVSYEHYPVHNGDGSVELYPGAIAYDNEMNAVVSDKDAYTGDKSMRLRNYGMQWVVTEANYNTAVSSGAYKYDAETDSFIALEEVPEFVAATPETIADGTAFAIKRISNETGMNVIREFPKTESISFSYKISFKYKATENNITTSTLSARLFPKANIWWGSPKNLSGSFTFAAGATDGWQDGVIYVDVADFTGVSSATADFLTAGYAFVLDLKFNGNSELATNEIYIDDVVIEEVGTATFNVLIDDATVTGEGNYADGVFTSFTLAAPVVKAANGATINKWYTDEACTEEATEFVEGGVYYGTLGYVEFVNGEEVTKVYYNEGDEIEYPAIAGTKGYDTYWSLNAESYEAVPATFEETVTVYAVKDTVIGFNNYVGHAYTSNTNLNVIDFEGNKVMKAEDYDYTVVLAKNALKEITTGEGDEAVTTIAWLTPGNNEYWANKYILDENDNWVKLSDIYEEAPEFEEGKYYSNRNNAMDHTVSLWQLEVGKSYKVSFKYYVTETLTKEYVVLPITSYYGNIWYAGQNKSYTANAYKIATDTAVGEWVEGELYFTNAASAEAYAWLFMALYQSDLSVGDVVYFDDFALTEVEVATFIIPEDATFEQGGIFKDNVVTVYVEAGEEIVAPLVIDAEGNPVDFWADENGKVVDAFVNGGVYYVYVAPAFIYGDCNDDGAVDTTDLAALKIFLAGSGDAGLGADCDASGNIDTGDLAALKLFLAGTGDLGPAQ